MRALLLNGQIVDVAAADFAVHPSMQWVAAPADARPDTHEFAGGVVRLKVKTQAEIDAEDTARALAELRALDLASIRPMREYIAGKPDAPQVLKDREAAAIAARARIKV